jgi:sec-independent protein translocase protein TatB
VLDISWAELLVIVVVAVLVIGPQDIPKIMYTLGRVFRRFQYVRFALSKQFEDFLKEHDLEELRRGVNFEAPETDEKTADIRHTESHDGQRKPD